MVAPVSCFLSHRLDKEGQSHMHPFHRLTTTESPPPRPSRSKERLASSSPGSMMQSPSLHRSSAVPSKNMLHHIFNHHTSEFLPNISVNRIMTPVNHRHPLKTITNGDQDRRTSVPDEIWNSSSSALRNCTTMTTSSPTQTNSSEPTKTPPFPLRFLSPTSHPTCRGSHLQVRREGRRRRSKDLGR